MSSRPVSISHLVFGLIFLGITTLWLVAATTDVEAPALALWGPVVLIAAGAVGLAAIVFNSRVDASPDATPSDLGAAPVDDEATPAAEPEYAGTADEEEQA
jgi:hypothetical protein